MKTSREHWFEILLMSIDKINIWANCLLFIHPTITKPHNHELFILHPNAYKSNTLLSLRFDLVRHHSTRACRMLHHVYQLQVKWVWLLLEGKQVVQEVQANPYWINSCFCHLRTSLSTRSFSRIDRRNTSLQHTVDELR